MSEANWPVRVGGVYKARNFTWSCRVTAFDGDDVHYILRTPHPITGEVMEHGAPSSSIDVFRGMFSPKDASPIPQMREALVRCLEHLSGHECADGLRSQIQAALAAADAEVSV